MSLTAAVSESVESYMAKSSVPSTFFSVLK